MAEDALLRPCPAESRWKFKGSAVASTFLLASSGIGSGLFTLPYTLQETGPRVGCILMVLGFLLSSVSTFVLLLGSSRLQANTMGRVVDGAIGFNVKFCGVSALDSIFFVYLTTTVVSFLSFLGDFLPTIIESIAGKPLFGQSLSICLCAMVIAMLTIVNRMNFVRHIASLGLLAVLTIATVVVVKSGTLIPEQGDAIFRAWNAPMRFSWDTMRASGNVIFSFCIGANVPAVAVEMQRPSMRNVWVVAFVANGIMLLFYVSIAFVVYFSFAASGVAPDFTESYSKQDTSMNICRGMLIFTMLAVAALNFIPGMKCLYAVIGSLRGHPSDYEIGIFNRAIFVCSLCSICAVAAVLLKNISVFVSWLGAVFGAPELLLGPLLLVYHGKVGDLSGVTLAIVVMLVLACMAFLWTAAVSDMLS